MSKDADTPDLAGGPRRACRIDGAAVETVEPLAGENGCGIAEAVRLSGVDGGNPMMLSGLPIVDCGFAADLAAWLSRDVAGSAREILGSSVKEVLTGPGYICRRRNNSPDGKLSEHALGRAIDITAFRMSDGRVIDFENYWKGEGPEARFLKTIHKMACARFSTVLGPDADVHHHGHIHLDIGCHGKTCTYRICQ